MPTIRPIPLAASLMALAALFVGSAQAQSANVAASAAIAYSNLLAPALVAEVRATFDVEPTDPQYAEAILTRMLSDAIIDESTYFTFSNAIFLNEPLSQGFFELWLLDVITGTEPLVDVLVTYNYVVLDENGDPSPPLSSLANDPELDFESALDVAAPGLVIPSRDDDGFIGGTEAVSEAIVTILDDPDVVEELQRRYDDAISPTNPDDVG